VFAILIFLEPIATQQCPRYRSRLEVFETTSGWRTVSVMTPGPTVEDHPWALGTFQPRDEGRAYQVPGVWECIRSGGRLSRDSAPAAAA